MQELAIVMQRMELNATHVRLIIKAGISVVG